MDKREEEILAARLRGKTLKQISNIHRVGPERIKQILVKIEKEINCQNEIIAKQRKAISTYQGAEKDPRGEGARVDYMHIGVREGNCLLNMGIDLVSDLEYIPESGFLRIPNFGKKSLESLREEALILGVVLGKKSNMVIFNSCTQRGDFALGIHRYLKIVKGRI